MYPDYDQVCFKCPDLRKKKKNQNAELFKFVGNRLQDAGSRLCSAMLGVNAHNDSQWLTLKIVVVCASIKK